MIKLKKCNYIIGNSIDFGFNRVIDFIETDGRTPILFYNSNSVNLLGPHIFKPNKIEFKNKNHLIELLNDKPNLFRVDLIIIDLRDINFEVLKTLNDIGLDYIIICNNYKLTNDVMVYSIDKGIDNNYIITDIISGWSSTIEQLKLSYIRNKKIDDILD